jgi:hypothetical protein
MPRDLSAPILNIGAKRFSRDRLNIAQYGVVSKQSVSCMVDRG